MTADPFAHALAAVATWLAAYAVASLAAGLVLGRLMSVGGDDGDRDNGPDPATRAFLARAIVPVIHRHQPYPEARHEGRPHGDYHAAQ